MSSKSSKEEQIKWYQDNWTNHERGTNNIKKIQQNAWKRDKWYPDNSTRKLEGGTNNIIYPDFNSMS